MSALLEARGLSVRRGGRIVIEDVTFAIASGEAVALVGPNAAGKSTLVRALAGVLLAAAGEVRLRGRPLPECSRDAVARAIALVAPDDATPATLSVEERVRLGRFPHRGPFRAFTAADEAAVRRALERTGVEALARRSIATLSAGERQLATLARGLAQEPAVLPVGDVARARGRRRTSTSAISSACSASSTRCAVKGWPCWPSCTIFHGPRRGPNGSSCSAAAASRRRAPRTPCSRAPTHPRPSRSRSPPATCLASPARSTSSASPRPVPPRARNLQAQTRRTGGDQCK